MNGNISARKKIHLTFAIDFDNLKIQCIFTRNRFDARVLIKKMIFVIHRAVHYNAGDALTFSKINFKTPSESIKFSISIVLSKKTNATNEMNSLEHSKQKGLIGVFHC